MSYNLTDHLKTLKQASKTLVEISDQKRSEVLRDLADHIIAKQNHILSENKKDLEAMETSNPMYDRLLLNAERLDGIAGDLRSVADMDTPLDKILYEYKKDIGTEPLLIQKKSVPVGVVGVIYESRPNVTVDVFSLCFKSGNAVALKGGKEADYSNKVFTSVIQNVLKHHDIDPNIVYLLPPQRELVSEMLQAVGYIDIAIPRGSQGLINFVRDNAKIPVIETGAGVVHTYLAPSGRLDYAKDIVFNAKTRRVSVCNALDCLVIDESRLHDLPEIMAKLPEQNVEVFADPQSYAVLKDTYPSELLFEASEDDFGREFLSYKMSIKTVSGFEEAIAHVDTYSSGHSETIISEDAQELETYLNRIDAAAVYANASTAFTDGAQFGLGAEIGISTQKLHARGPMGLEALTSTKWVIHGKGHIRTS